MIREKNSDRTPSKKLLALMNKYNIPDDLALAIGEEAVRMAQELFVKWKKNFEKAQS